eukprot:Awhi_evm1s12986
MNVPHLVVVETFMALTGGNLVKNGALIVLTMKNFMGGEKSMERHLQQSIETLTPFAQDGDLKCLHLMMNGVLERTIIFHYNSHQEQ